MKPEVVEYFREMGRKRGSALRDQYGSEYFKKISSMRKSFGRKKEKGSISDLASEFGKSRQRIYQILDMYKDTVNVKDYSSKAEWRRFILVTHFVNKEK